MSAASKPRDGFAIFIDTLFQGSVPLVSDGNGTFVIFDTEAEAQREIADYMIIRLQQFLTGERDFDDAIEVEEYVVPVKVYPNGTFTDEVGRVFRWRVD